MDSVGSPRRLFAFCLALLLLASSPVAGMAQSTNQQYFDETGHNVSGAFLEFFRQAPDPLLVYGYPITPSTEGAELMAKFLPKLDEGALWVRATMPYTISFDEAANLAPQIRGILTNAVT